MLLAGIDGTVRLQKINFSASWIWRGAHASVACRKLEGYEVFGREDIDSNGLIRMNELRRVALETILRDLDALVVAIQQVEGFGLELQLRPQAIMKGAR